MPSARRPGLTRRSRGGRARGEAGALNCNHREGGGTRLQTSCSLPADFGERKIIPRAICSQSGAGAARGSRSPARQPDPVSGRGSCLPRAYFGKRLNSGSSAPAPPPSRHFPSLTPSAAHPAARSSALARPAASGRPHFQLPHDVGWSPISWDGGEGGGESQGAGWRATQGRGSVGATPSTHPQAPDPPGIHPVPGPIPPPFSPQGCPPPLMSGRGWVAGMRASQAGLTAFSVERLGWGSGQTGVSGEVRSQQCQEDPEPPAPPGDRLGDSEPPSTERTSSL